MPDPASPPLQLIGWKKIAAYLAVSLRTAQNYENELGLPVHRQGVGPKAPVYALVTELETWKAGLAAARPGSISEAAPDVKALHVSRRLWLRYAVAGGAMALGGLGLWAANVISGSHQPPSAYRIEGATLIVLGRGNAELWRYTFSKQLSEEHYSHHPKLCQFADLGGGNVETIFAFGGAGHLFAFNPHGKLLWQFQPGKSVTDSLGRTFSPPYGFSTFDILHGPALKITKIVASSHHNWSFPNQVAVLDAKTGELLGEYWHRGHLWHTAVVDLDGDGEPEVLLGGVNDAPEYKQATLVVFDHRRISGASRDPAGRAYFHGMELGTEKAEIFFPRTPISRNEEFNRVSAVEVESDRIRVTVAEGITETAPSVLYEFDFNLRPINALLVGLSVQNYRQLQESGASPTEAPEEIAQGLINKIRVIERRQR